MTWDTDTSPALRALIDYLLKAAALAAIASTAVGRTRSARFIVPQVRQGVVQVRGEQAYLRNSRPSAPTSLGHPTKLELCDLS